MLTKAQGDEIISQFEKINGHYREVALQTLFTPAYNDDEVFEADMACVFAENLLDDMIFGYRNGKN